MIALPPRCLLLAALAAACGGCALLSSPDAPATSATQVQLLSAAELDELAARGDQAMAAGNADQARMIYQRIVAIAPDRPAVWFRLGIIHLRDGRAGLAQQAFEQAIRTDPTLGKAQANLALAHLLQFRAAAARAIGSDQVSQDNKLALTTVMRDVDHALAPSMDAQVSATAPQATGP